MNEFLGKKVIIRSTNAGVFMGKLKEIDGDAVVLNDVRRIWKWYGAFTLSEVSQCGINDNSRVAITVPEMIILGVIEVIPATAEAVARIEICHE